MSGPDTGADRDPGPDGREVVRQESRPVDGPADLDLAVDVGRVRVHLADAAGPASGLPPALDEQLLMQLLEAFALGLQPGALGGDILQ